MSDKWLSSGGLERLLPGRWVLTAWTWVKTGIGKKNRDWALALDQAAFVGAELGAFGVGGVERVVWQREGLDNGRPNRQSEPYHLTLKTAYIYI